MGSTAGIDVAVKVAEQRRDEAREAWMASVAEAGRADAQMHQLQNYAKECEDRWMSQGARSVTPEIMRHHYLFMARLEHAISFQQNVCNQRSEVVGRCHAAWTGQELHLTSLQSLQEKLLRQRQNEQDRLEQKRSDEQASHLVRRRNLVGEGSEQHENE